MKTFVSGFYDPTSPLSQAKSSVTKEVRKKIYNEYLLHVFFERDHYPRHLRLLINRIDEDQANQHSTMKPAVLTATLLLREVADAEKTNDTLYKHLDTVAQSLRVVDFYQDRESPPYITNRGHSTMLASLIKIADAGHMRAVDAVKAVFINEIHDWPTMPSYTAQLINLVTFKKFF